MQRLLIVPILILFCAVASIFSQAYEYIIADTLWAKVTFYDFHSNSNFGGKNCGTATGEVQDTLDSDRKPLFLQDLCANDLLSQWYRPSGAPEAVFQPYTGLWSNLTSYNGKQDEWVGKAFNAGNEMANIVIYDSLPFQLVDSATGTYTFSRTNKHPSGGFFWLDGKGFGEEPAGSGHNFYFTMELHKQFLYKGGEKFSFSGDDDVWVFINGKLALDLGGMQAETKRALDLDAIADQFGLEKGQQYPMDFFFCERHEPQSNCEITTNLLTPVRPSSMLVTTTPVPPNPVLVRGISDTVLRAGTTLPLYVYLFDENGMLRTDYNGMVTWHFISQEGSQLRTDTVATHINFTMPAVAGCITLQQTFDDPDDQLPAIVNSIRICPGSGSTPSDTGLPHDTTTVPPDTIITNPHDTTVTPGDTTGIPVDSIGAVIERVLYYPSMGAALYDTLRIILTDPVECATLKSVLPESVFRLSNQGTGVDKALVGARFISGCDSIMVFDVKVLVPVSTLLIEPEKDSMVLNGASPFVVDKKGDLPPPAMKAVSIEWGSTALTISALQNPSSATTVIDPKFVTIFMRNFTEGSTNNDAAEKVGTIVAIQTKVPLLLMENPPAKAGVGDVYGVANVYDGVGNIVAVNLPLKLSNMRNTYGVHWNMRNRNKRVVGKGAYLIMVSFTPENTGKVMKKASKIGVW